MSKRIIKMDRGAKIYVAGHYGMVGSAIVRRLKREGYENIIGHSSKELDLTNQSAVEEFYQRERPDYVFMAAAKVGGIYANSTYPADFIYTNLQIQNNLIHNAYLYKVKKLLFLGSSCIYPKHAPQPMPETCLLDGKLEATNEYYAIAKIAGIKMCEAYNKEYGTKFISCMPTNLYGPNDNYEEMNSHVLPALIRRFHEAKINNLADVLIWGTGTPKREFLYVDDLADACLFLMENHEGNETVNIGSGMEVTITELAKTVKKIVGFKGKIKCDPTKPDGTSNKLLDSSKIERMGWRVSTGLEEGIALAYREYLKK